MIAAEGGASPALPFFSRCLRIVAQYRGEPDGVHKGKERAVPHLTEDSLRRIIINPFYAITVAPQLIVAHVPPMDETEWVRTNATQIGEMGAARGIRLKSSWGLTPGW